MKKKEREEVKQACTDLLTRFDLIENFDTVKQFPLTEFIYDLSDDESSYKRIEARIGNDPLRGLEKEATTDLLNDLVFETFRISIAIGIYLGQTFDVVNSPALERITKAMRREGILPYFSRERRTT